MLDIKRIFLEPEKGNIFEVCSECLGTAQFERMIDKKRYFRYEQCKSLFAQPTTKNDANK
jgi:hypothetical protein